MQTYAASTFIRPVKRNPIVRAEMPSELDHAISADCYLRPIFEQLSDVQKECYIDWIASEATHEGRVQRAKLVCSVVRSLADVVTGLELL